MPRRILSAAVIVYGCLPPAAAQTAILQVHVLEGEGAVHRLGTRTARALTVQVTDEVGQPVAGAAVAFRLPEEGPTGTFGNGLRSCLETTGPDGRVSVWGVHWGAVAGPVRIRVIAARDRARAGLAVTQFLSDAGPPGPADRPLRLGSRRAWWVALAAGAVSGAAIGAAKAGGARPAISGGPAALTAPVEIGPPSVSVGRP